MSTNTRLGGTPGVALSAPSLGPARDLPSAGHQTANLLAPTPGGDPQPLDPAPGGLSPLEEPLLPGRDLAGGSEPVDILEVTEFIRREARHYAGQGNWEAAYRLFSAAETNTRIHQLITDRRKAAGGKAHVSRQ